MPATTEWHGSEPPGGSEDGECVRAAKQYPPGQQHLGGAIGRLPGER